MKNKKRLVSLILCVLIISNCLNTVSASELFTRFSYEEVLPTIDSAANAKYLKELSKINSDLAGSVLVYQHPRFPVDPNELLRKQETATLRVYGYVVDKDGKTVDSITPDRIRFSGNLSSVHNEKAKIFYCKSLSKVDTNKNITMPDDYTLHINAFSVSNTNSSYDIITNTQFQHLYDSSLYTMFDFTRFSYEKLLPWVSPSGNAKYLKELSKVNGDLAGGVLVYEYPSFPVDPREVLPRENGFTLRIGGYVTDKNDKTVDSFTHDRIRFSNNLYSVPNEKTKVFYCKSLSTKDSAKTITMPDGYTIHISAAFENNSNQSYNIIMTDQLQAQYDSDLPDFIKRNYFGNPLTRLEFNIVMLGESNYTFIPKGCTLADNGEIIGEYGGAVGCIVDDYGQPVGKDGTIVNPSQKGDDFISELMKYSPLLQSVFTQRNLHLVQSLIVLGVFYNSVKH